MKYVLWALRIIVGVLFIFSGIVKANDPMGLVYKMQEFFEVLNMTFMNDWSFVFSVVMISFEIVCGVAVLLGYSFRLFATLLVLLNVFFTFLTGYALVSGKVKECGCFGACIKISSEATFYKDVVLLVLSLVLFFYRNRITGLFNRHINTAIMIIAVVFSAGIQWWALQHLPFNDCMPYKPGNNIWEKLQPGPDYKPAVIQSMFTYQKDGKKQEFTQDNYPWKDTTWKFVERKDKVITEAVGEPEVHDFILTDSDNNDQTQAILTAKGYTFFWFVREFDKAHMDNMDKLHGIMAKAAAMHIPFYVLSSSDRPTSMPFMQQWGLTGVPMFTLDGTASKTAIRTNPGLMLLKDGIIQKKWSFRDYPADVTMNNGQIEFK